MVALSKRQAETLAFIRGYLDMRGYAPSLREIADELGVASVATAHQHVRALEEKGAISKGWNRKRSIVPVGAGRHGGGVKVPWFGAIAASPPAESFPLDDELEVPAALVGAGEHFGLTVRGDSMIEDGIRDGDIVIVKRQDTAAEGQTVAILVDGEVTLKRFHRKNGHVVLQPANQVMQPIVLTSGDVRIQGVVVALLRQYRS